MMRYLDRKPLKKWGDWGKNVSTSSPDNGFFFCKNVVIHSGTYTFHFFRSLSPREPSEAQDGSKTVVRVQTTRLLVEKTVRNR